MNITVPKFDLPVDFMVGNDIFEDTLGFYSRFPCRMKSQFFIMCLQGRLRATINLAEFTIVPGDFVVLLPDTFIQIHEMVGEVRLYYAGFSSHFMDQANLNNSFFDMQPVIMENPVSPLTHGLCSVYEDYFKLLIRVQNNPKFYLTSPVQSSVLSIFQEQTSELYRERHKAKQAHSGREREIYREFIRLLREHYANEHSVSFYASKLGVTLQHFSNTIKKASGNTASEIIVRMLIMDAKTQLKSTSNSVKQIALSLGFENISFFYKFFKQHVGMTPQEYRDH